jgi:hypothetical protein
MSWTESKISTVKRFGAGMCTRNAHRLHPYQMAALRAEWICGHVRCSGVVGPFRAARVAPSELRSESGAHALTLHAAAAVKSRRGTWPTRRLRTFLMPKGEADPGIVTREYLSDAREKSALWLLYYGKSSRSAIVGWRSRTRRVILIDIRLRRVSRSLIVLARGPLGLSPRGQVVMVPQLMSANQRPIRPGRERFYRPSFPLPETR